MPLFGETLCDDIGPTGAPILLAVAILPEVAMITLLSNMEITGADWEPFKTVKKVTRDHRTVHAVQKKLTASQISK